LPAQFYEREITSRRLLAMGCPMCPSTRL
jgi:hypothetical protein